MWGHKLELDLINVDQGKPGWGSLSTFRSCLLRLCYVKYEWLRTKNILKPMFTANYKLESTGQEAERLIKHSDISTYESNKGALINIKAIFL